MSDLTTPQLAYIAGLIDGEGSLECQKQMQKRGRTPRYVLRLAFTMSTPEPLETTAMWLGLTPKWYPVTDSRRQATCRLSIPKGITVPLLRQCLPYLILKHEAAKLILAIEEVRAKWSPTRHHFGSAKLEPMPQRAVEEMETLHQRLRATKSNKRPIRCRVAA